jgi:hypothetical protein
MLWTGRASSLLPVLMLFASSVIKLARPEFLVEEFERLGYPETLALPVGVVELACTVVYVVPQTSVLGAVLLTGY